MAKDDFLSHHRAKEPLSAERFAPSNLASTLGPLADLAGTWRGRGFNLIARPDFHDQTDLYLQLNHTDDEIKFDPIGAPVPNRGFGQDDINLFGLTYLQKITDATLGSALHIEPGIWVTLPSTLTFPPDRPPTGGHLVARMGTIPHGNSILVEGFAEAFTGPPVLKTSTEQYNGSIFPSFNSTPFGVPPTAPNPPGIVINAAGSSEKLTAPTVPATPFPQYDLSIPIGAIPAGFHVGATVYNPPFSLNTRTPFNSTFPGLNNTPKNQALVNDPITLLQDEVHKLVHEGYSFEGTALNIATQATINFLKTPNSGAGGLVTPLTVPTFGGGTPDIPNIQFLLGETITTTPPNPPGSKPVENAQTALVYATFWIEKVTHKQTHHTFMQLQYAQMVVLNFPIFHLFTQTPATYVNLGWPHITVGTLRKMFG